jgi:ApaG protein
LIRHNLDAVRCAPDIVAATGSAREIDRMYSETTRDIKVTVRPFYLDQHSSPAEDRYVWAYHVRIENEGSETVQLRNRHWQITDALGRLHEVRGPGVVGEEPVLKPGQSFEYTSSCPLTTPSGFMVGDYEMETPAGEKFLIRVPAFSLDSPQEARRLN